MTVRSSKPKIDGGRVLSLLRVCRTEMKKRTIIVGLSSDNCSREVLLRLLTSVVMRGDNVLAVHVLEPDDAFDPNSFHIHEDLCKSKQVDFQVKVCEGDSYLSELSHQVRINFAAILALGCSSPWPKSSTVTNCLKALPPTCSLLVMDSGGRILMQGKGTSQEGSERKFLQSSQEGSERKVLQSSLSCGSNYNNHELSRPSRQIQKSLTMPSSSNASRLQQIETSSRHRQSLKKSLQLPDLMKQELSQRLAILEITGSGRHRRFTLEELSTATHDFSPEFIIGEGGNSKVYCAKLDNGQLAALKVLKNTDSSADDLFREVETLSSLEHENVVQLIGYSYSKRLQAVVYNLLNGSLKQNLKELRWRERMRIAIGVARALDYLHSRSPAVIHRDVKSSNVLLSDNWEPKLSDFGAAVTHHKTWQVSGQAKPFRIVGTFGYLAPEYMMYGKVDEKIDVYSFGVVLLELITGKEAIQTNLASNHESLVLWARSLLSSGLCERLIDPYLKDDYDKDEMKTMMIAARLCLLHSSSRRPTMKKILQLFEEPEQWLWMQRKREELLNRITSKGEAGFPRHDDSDSFRILSIDES